MSQQDQRGHVPDRKKESAIVVYRERGAGAGGLGQHPSRNPILISTLTGPLIPILILISQAIMIRIRINQRRPILQHPARQSGSHKLRLPLANLMGHHKPS